MLDRVSALGRAVFGRQGCGEKQPERDGALWRVDIFAAHDATDGAFVQFRALGDVAHGQRAQGGGTIAQEIGLMLHNRAANREQGLFAAVHRADQGRGLCRTGKKRPAGIHASIKLRAHRVIKPEFRQQARVEGQTEAGAVEANDQIGLDRKSVV